jgi:ribosomal protein S18 acetylase RimI-like enzyme
MLSLIRLQEYLRFQAHHHHEVIAAPPFPLFLHATDTSSAANYALPDASGSSNDLQESFARLQTIFAERHRLPTLRFIEEGFPQFPSSLISAGWSERERLQVMICRPVTGRPASTVFGLTITTLSRESSLQEICEGLDANALGFDPQAQRATQAEAEAFRQQLVASRAFAAYLHDQPVGAGMFTQIHEGLTELVGITTLSAFRRRGIATALTAYMAQSAFEQGATFVFLIAATTQAGHVYERAGFCSFATLVEYGA